MLTTAEPTRLATCMPAVVEAIGHAERQARVPALRGHRWPYRRCAVYRQYDDQGVLLYVGISTDLLTRRRSHIKRSAWVEFASVESSVWYDSIEVARAAERDAIINELPIFNIVHADADRDVLLRDYLIRRGAWHLLTQEAS